MLTRLLTIGVLAAALLAGSAHADIMHWFWEVEVNGTPADASQPIVVGAGDQVDIELWAEFDPYGEGFAWAVFSLYANDSFFELGDVTIDGWRGYGLNENLDGMGGNGVFADSDGNGQLDMVDHITAVQFPPFFNAEFDASNPINVYRVGWSILDTGIERISLTHGPSINGDFGNGVYSDIYGDFREYDSTSETLILVPSPSSGAILLICISVLWKQHNRVK